MRPFSQIAEFTLAFVLISSGGGHAQLGDRPGESQERDHSWNAPPSPALTREQALQTFEVEDGYRLELVAAEPLVQDPIAMAFDEQARLWVVEMRGFMPRLDATEEEESAPVGRVVVLEDMDADGRFEKYRVFLDGLVSPRTLAFFRSGILVNDDDALFYITDSDGDGRGDERVLIDRHYIRGGNVEHQPNGLLFGLDGWYYSAKSTKRYRFHQGKWQIEKTERRGQWGITRDDHGRLFYNYNWDQLRGDVAPPNALQRNPNHSSVTGLNLPVATDQRVHPIRLNTGVNRGYREGILDDSGKLLAFASACAPHIYRGHLMPAFSGNAFVCGPGANIVKRNVLIYDELAISSHPSHEDREFLASTDERFRPVFLSGGPDGALYIVDMYRGIIQHGAFMTTYLRKEIERRQLAAPIHLGRIYRIVPEDFDRQANETITLPTGSAEDFAHPNGWHRDTALRLLLERNDRSAIPALRALALRGSDPKAQTHALWALAGLEDNHPRALFPLIEADNADVAVTAIRVMERLAVEDEAYREALVEHLLEAAPSASLAVRFHVVLTLGELEFPERVSALARFADWHSDHPMMRDAIMSSAANRELELLQTLWKEARGRPGHLALLEALGSALVRERSVANLLALLDWLGEHPRQYDTRHEAVIAGMVIHPGQRRFRPITLPGEPVILGRLGEIPNENLRGLLLGWRRLFAWPGHVPPRREERQGPPLSPDEARRFAAGRRHYAALCSSCHASDGEGISPIAPPLVDSEWVLGDTDILTRILLHGLEGPVHVNGRRYAAPAIQPIMPPLMALPDDELAAVLTYVRRAWGHSARAVSPSDITKVRTATAGRLLPWTERELRVQGAER